MYFISMSNCSWFNPPTKASIWLLRIDDMPRRIKAETSSLRRTSFEFTGALSSTVRTASSYFPLSGNRRTHDQTWWRYDGNRWPRVPNFPFTTECVCVALSSKTNIPTYTTGMRQLRWQQLPHCSASRKTGTWFACTAHKTARIRTRLCKHLLCTHKLLMLPRFRAFILTFRHEWRKDIEKWRSSPVLLY